SLLPYDIEKNSIASSTLISSTSAMFLSLNFTSSTSSLKRFPPHDSQTRCTSARNCISTTCSPSPLQVSHLPPSTLNEKCFAWNPRILLKGCFENKSLIVSYALIYVTGLLRDDFPIGFWSTISTCTMLSTSPEIIL